METSGSFSPFPRCETNFKKASISRINTARCNLSQLVRRASHARGPWFDPRCAHPRNRLGFAIRGDSEPVDDWTQPSRPDCGSQVFYTELERDGARPDRRLGRLVRRPVVSAAKRVGLSGYDSRRRHWVELPDSIQRHAPELWDSVHPLWDAGNYADAADRGRELIDARTSTSIPFVTSPRSSSWPAAERTLTDASRAARSRTGTSRSIPRRPLCPTAARRTRSAQARNRYPLTNRR